MNLPYPATNFKVQTALDTDTAPNVVKNAFYWRLTLIEISKHAIMMGYNTACTDFLNASIIGSGGEYSFVDRPTVLEIVGSIR